MTTRGLEAITMTVNDNCFFTGSAKDIMFIDDDSSVSDAVFEISVRPDTANCFNRVSSPLVEGPNVPVKIVSVQGLSASVVIAGPLVRRTGRYRASRTVGLAAWSKFLRNACESPQDASCW